MKRIEYFCRNIRHGDPIEEQMEEAKKGGIIKSYTLTTLSAMNARRNADLCLWCDEIWSADHIHSCLCVPDHNCMFTCGIDFEVFAFVKVAKEGLKHVVVNDSQGEALLHGAEKVFEEMCDTKVGISSKETIISSAPQVFDELSQPVLSTNPGQIIEENQDNNALISNFDNNNQIQADDVCTHVHGNEETQIDGISSSLIQHSVDEVYEFEGESDKKFIKEIKKPSVYKMLDELPLPTFIQEMAEAAKTAELGAFEGDYEPASVIAHDLDKKSVQLPSCVVQVWCSCIRMKTNFSYLRSFNGRQHSTKVHQHRDNLLARNSYLELKHSHMPSEPVYVLNAMHFRKRLLLLHDSDLVMTLILPTVLGLQACNTKVFESKIGWRAFLTFKELYSWGIRPIQMFLLRLHLGYNQIDYMSSYILIYDPGDLVFGAAPSSIIFVFIEWNTRLWFYTLEDKGVFRGEKDTNGKCTWKLLNHLGLWSKYNASRTNICFVLLSYIFDPGCFAFCVGQLSMMMLDDWFVKLLLFSISTYSMIILASILVLEDNDGYMGEHADAYSLLYDAILHDLEIIINQVTNVHVQMVNTICEDLASNKLEITSLLFGLAHLGFGMVCDMSDFEEVGNDMGLALWWRMSSLICIMNHLATNGSILMTMTCSSLCFDPGGLHNKFCVVILIGLMRVATCIESTSVWIFDPGGIGDLLGSTSIMSTLYLVYGVGINRDGIMYLMFFSHHENNLFQGGVAGYVCYCVHHGLVSINSEEMSKSLISHFIVGQMKQLSAIGHYLVSTYCHSPTDYTIMILGYGIKNQKDTILIFDPGGFKSWLKMRNLPEFTGCKRLKHMSNEDYQVYVFDPGGPLMRLVMDAMVTNPKPGMCYDIACFKYHLSLILEDKDHFKRRVLIHIKNETKGSLVIYLLFLISQVI